MSALAMPKIVVFSDVNPDVHLESPFELVFNEDAVKKSFETIFTTPYGSRVFRRRFGTKLMDLMYEPIDTTTAAKMEIMLRETALLWEPRADKITVLVLPDIENQRYYVEMKYRIPSLGDKMVTYKFNVSK